MWDVVSLLFPTKSSTERLIFDSKGTVYNGNNSTYRPPRPLQTPQTKSKARFVDQSTLRHYELTAFWTTLKFEATLQTVSRKLPR